MSGGTFGRGRLLGAPHLTLIIMPAALPHSLETRNELALLLLKGSSYASSPHPKHAFSPSYSLRCCSFLKGRGRFVLKNKMQYMFLLLFYYCIYWKTDSFVILCNNLDRFIKKYMLHFIFQYF